MNRVKNMSAGLVEYGKREQPRLTIFQITTLSLEGVGPVPDLYDLDEEVYHIYGVLRPLWFLMRLDGHVGARVKGGDLDSLTRYMEYRKVDSRP
jgi:hypothetical protein